MATRLNKMQVGDLVKPKNTSWQDVGLIVESGALGFVLVMWPDTTSQLFKRERLESIKCK